MTGQQEDQGNSQRMPQTLVQKIIARAAGKEQARCGEILTCDVDLALLLEDVFLLHSHGGVSTAHTGADVDFVGQACRKAARRIKAYL